MRGTTLGAERKMPGRKTHAGHEGHLCKLWTGDRIPLEEYKPLVNAPRFICSECGRVANRKENLCSPVEL